MPEAAKAGDPAAAPAAGRAGGQRVVRRVRLPADRRTPAAARAVVRSVLEDADLAELLDPALLLTTELSTNAVVHAGTDLELEAIADPAGLTVTVLDDAKGMVTKSTATATAAAGAATGAEPRGGNGQRPAMEDVPDRGRGLLLVDHFAHRWGTTHFRDGKGVWFRLNRPGAAEGADRAIATIDSTMAGTGGGERDEQVADPPALTTLLAISPDPYADEPGSDFAAALLSRLVDLTGASGGVVRCDLGEGVGPIVLARYGRTPRPGAPTVRVPLALGGPATGELELDTAVSEYVRPLAVLAAERLTLALENDRLRRADRRRQTWLTFLAEASELLAQSLDVELTLALIPQLVVPRLGQWSAVHTTDAWGKLELETAAHADENLLPQLYDLLRETGPDSVGARLPEALRLAGKVPLPSPTEGFAVPLIARGQLIGTLSVGRHAHRRHEPDEVAVLQDVARRAALAVDNARIHAERRSVALTLQKSLLPPQLPAVPGIGFGAAYVPTGDAAEVGGDFYDVVPLRDDRWLLVIGDVSGKGVQAATVTGLVREVIRALVRGGRPLLEIIDRINETLVERGRGRFCTLALASVERAAAGPAAGPAGPAVAAGVGAGYSGGVTVGPAAGRAPGPAPPAALATLAVTLHLAGHERPVLLRADGRTSQVGTGGTALGLLESVTCPAETVWLRPNDSLIFFTDGVTERRRGRELFGTQRLRDATTPLAGYSAELIAARLRTATIGFSTEQPRDDIAVLVVRNELANPPVRARAKIPPIKE